MDRTPDDAISLAAVSEKGFGTGEHCFSFCKYGYSEDASCMAGHVSDTLSRRAHWYAVVDLDARTFGTLHTVAYYRSPPTC